MGKPHSLIDFVDCVVQLQTFPAALLKQGLVLHRAVRLKESLLIFPVHTVYTQRMTYRRFAVMHLTVLIVISQILSLLLQTRQTYEEISHL